MKAIPEIFALHQEMDRVMPAIHKKCAENGMPVTCPGKGCSACCYEPVYCERREVEHALGRLPPRIRDYVKRRTRDWLAAVEPSGLLNEKEPLVFPWRALRAACPFLYQEKVELNGYHRGLCLIYQDRPVSCRMHCVLGPPEHCYDDEARKEQKYPKSEEVLMHMALTMRELFERTTYDNLGVWCAEMLLGKKMPPSIRRRTENLRQIKPRPASA